MRIDLINVVLRHQRGQDGLRCSIEHQQVVVAGPQIGLQIGDGFQKKFGTIDIRFQVVCRGQAFGVEISLGGGRCDSGVKAKAVQYLLVVLVAGEQWFMVV